jgi:hypothetical protein
MNPETRLKNHLFWIGYYFSIGIFALNGTIKHFTTSQVVYDITRKIDVTAGCLGIFWMQLAIPLTLVTKKIQNTIWFWINATLSLLLVNISLILTDWDFIMFGYYLILIIVEFIVFGLAITMKNIPSNNFIATEIAIFFGFAFVIGMIFLIGRHKWLISYGPEDQFVLNIGNEIFHIGIMYPNYRLFKAIFNQTFRLQDSDAK